MGLRSTILELLRSRGPLTAKQICRILNGRDRCPLEYNPKTGWMDRQCHKCTIPFSKVYSALKWLERSGLVISWYAEVVEDYPGGQKNYSSELYRLFDARDHWHPEVLGPGYHDHKPYAAQNSRPIDLQARDQSISNSVGREPGIILYAPGSRPKHVKTAPGGRDQEHAQNGAGVHLHVQGRDHESKQSSMCMR